VQAHYDCIIIGAGHNGLVCGALLAKRGKRVLIVEASASIGGAAATHEFAPGFRASTAHLLHLMPRSLMVALGLEQHGLKLAASNLPTTSLSPAGNHLLVTPEGVAAASPADAEAYPAFVARMSRLAGALRPMLASVPPRLGTDSWSDRIALLKLGWQVRRLGRRDMRELLRIIGMNAYDLCTDYLTAPLLQGALAFEATLGGNLGPRAPGTVLPWLIRLAMQGADGQVGLAQPAGGMGGLADALASAAKAAGAEIRTGARVERVLVADDRVTGVVLGSGESYLAPVVVSNADPKTTLIDLLGPEHLDTEFVRRVDRSRSKGVVAKLHLALDRLPAFANLPESALRGRLLLAPSLGYVEKAFDAPKYGEYAAQPAMEITVPTVSDPSLAPPGGHVLSAIVECAAYDLRAGWPAQRAAFEASLIDQLDGLAPGLRRSIKAAELLTPVDLEARYGNRGGHWHHVDLALDQFYFVRPVAGAAQYSTPVSGLFLCGAATHPGGGVAGENGRLAAQAVLAKAV
jgi:phytoene dehydrogenase-like protein